MHPVPSLRHYRHEQIVQPGATPAAKERKPAYALRVQLRRQAHRRVRSEVRVTRVHDEGGKVVLASFEHPLPNGARLA